ncbi:hypothetical protein RFI_26668, partial [Reticulomyxa filosa]
PDQYTQIAKIPYPIKSPFNKWIEPTQEEILNTLDEKMIAIFVDGTANQIHGKDKRIVILSNCKFAVNAIHNKCNSDTYNFSISDCQRLMKELGENDVPEIYWIKGHFGVTGNERADFVAKIARFQAEFDQPENEMEPHKCYKQYLRNLIEAQSFEKIILHRLDAHERRYLCRIITGKVGLNSLLYKIKVAKSPVCK